MSAKFTPGPWCVEFDEVYAVRSQQDGGRVAMMTNLKGQFGMQGRRSSDEVAANTRLMAAAPDLLEVLQLFVQYEEYVESEKYEAAMAAYLQLRKDARAAIAKALGETE